MKQLFLASTLILAPVAAFTAFNVYRAGATVSEVSLGDMTSFKTIITDVQNIAGTGDSVAAETRITDFETAWDDAAGAMRPLNPTSWGNVDDAADAALGALRANAPAADEVSNTLTTLMAELNNPDLTPGEATTAAPATVGGIAVTDANGRALPCEEMLKVVTAAMASSTLAGADQASAADFQAKATERCNADDDQRADAFSAQALALLTK